jgi:exodeoxyribonuclease V alpha subunit
MSEREPRSTRERGPGGAGAGSTSKSGAGRGEARGDGLELLEGVVERTVFHAAESRWTVLRAKVEGEVALVTAVGRTNGIEDGADFSAHGRWVVHPTHGRQFQFEALKLRRPTTDAQIIARLKTYPGIKEVMAARIVKRFGPDTLDILDSAPRRLLEVDGLGQKTLASISAHHEARQGPLAELEDRLLELEVSPRLGEAIQRRYGDQAQAMLEHHPYVLAREVYGIGFTTADKIARALGVDLDSDERVDAGVLHTLERAQSDGHCALPPEQLIAAGQDLLGLPVARIEAGVDRLIASGDLVPRVRPDGLELYFLSRFDDAEERLVDSLIELAFAGRDAWEVGDLPAHLSPGQQAAVAAIARCGVVILTGGPGTGKSTVVANVIEVAKRAGEALLLAAPTGRAAKRLEQTSGEPARTVHRLLEVRPDTGQFQFCANNPLPDGLVVIDESSMLDLELAEALITALTPQNRLLLVGDADQLPSVGPGNVLRDLIRACDRLASGAGEVIPVVRLDTIFRQQEGSTIVRNAHQVLHGQALIPDEPSRGKAGEFFVIRAADAERTHAKIVEMAAERIPAAYGFDRIAEIQVLCPMHKGRAGTEAFNVALQHIYTGQNEGLDALGARGGSDRDPGRSFRVGDRVMQIRNDYERGVFNGDIGVVQRVQADKGSLTVDFEGVFATYERKDLGSLRLAYAISIHKSQGSEFPAVIIPMLTEHHVMLRRNLLYTAMTRARRLCVLVGDPRAIDRAIRRADAALRWTGLAERTEAMFEQRLAGGVEMLALEP